MASRRAAAAAVTEEPAGTVPEPMWNDEEFEGDVPGEESIEEPIDGRLVVEDAPEPQRVLPRRNARGTRNAQASHRTGDTEGEMSLQLKADMIRLSRFFEITPTGLVIKGKPSLDTCGELFGFFKVMHSSLQFAVGDAIVRVEGMFGEEASQLIDSGDWSEETVRNYRWVAAKIPMSVRSARLSFGHHQAVASFDSHETQRLWIDRAVENSWTVADLRKAIKLADVPAGTVAQAASKFEVHVICDSPDDVEACVRQLDNIGRKAVKKVIKEA